MRHAPIRAQKMDAVGECGEARSGKPRRNSPWRPRFCGRGACAARGDLCAGARTSVASAAMSSVPAASRTPATHSLAAPPQDAHVPLHLGCERPTKSVHGNKHNGPQGCGAVRQDRRWHKHVSVRGQDGVVRQRKRDTVRGEEGSRPQRASRPGSHKHGVVVGERVREAGCSRDPREPFRCDSWCDAVLRRGTSRKSTSIDPSDASNARIYRPRSTRSGEPNCIGSRGEFWIYGLTMQRARFAREAPALVAKPRCNLLRRESSRSCEGLDLSRCRVGLRPVAGKPRLEKDSSRVTDLAEVMISGDSLQISKVRVQELIAACTHAPQTERPTLLKYDTGGCPKPPTGTGTPSAGR